MASFISTFLLLVVVATATPAVSQSSDPSEMCHDWGESSEGAVSILEGETGWLSCPLFSHPSVYNYSSAQSAGHNLFWYRFPNGQDLEQPITSSSRISKDRERLWLQPAAAADTGQYICMLRNKSSCSKIAMRLTVLQRDEVVPGADCEPPVAVAARQAIIPLQEGKTLDCPDLQEAAKMAESEPTVSWYHVRKQKCLKTPFWNRDREQKGVRLHIHVMYDNYQGLYFCTVRYQRRGQTLNFTRSINVTAVYPSSLPKEPSILNPTKDQTYTVKQKTEVRLVCIGIFPYLDSPSEIWWTVDGKTVDQLADNRFSKTSRLVKYDYGDRMEENVLVIKDFQYEDINRKYNCSVRNSRGFETRAAQLQEEGEEK